MINRVILGASALVVLVGVALAEAPVQNTNPAPTPQIDNQTADNGPPPDQQGWWGHKHHRHGMMGDNGPDGRMGMGPQGGMMLGKGFHIALGNGQRLDINCGDEPMKQCIDSAQPLIDALTKSVVAQAQTNPPKTP
jgi:hypothetical protein